MLDQHYNQAGDTVSLASPTARNSHAADRYLNSPHAGIDSSSRSNSNIFQQPCRDRLPVRGPKRQDWLAERAELHQQKAERPRHRLELLPRCKNTKRAIALMISLVRSRRSTNNSLDIREAPEQAGDGAEPCVDQSNLTGSGNRWVASLAHPAVRGAPGASPSAYCDRGDQVGSRGQNPGRTPSTRRVLRSACPRDWREAQVHKAESKPLWNLC